ncbi:hypothetical protein QJS10_CPB15g00777 [Acorus calamus]|uniref:Uncharacterized protein n=1 Tax=Acorus calamus TaxID=4465 RepID=A0AAV9D581_ACOCL|nr:hypothetical protein QJS10_CPB15g00777 [Acorus calamus]
MFFEARSVAIDALQSRISRRRRRKWEDQKDAINLQQRNSVQPLPQAFQDRLQGKVAQSLGPAARA